jgi:peptidoglycan/LPS O-acetylase OafA/YrhL
MQPRTQLPALTSMRFFAALAVLAYHFEPRMWFVDQSGFLHTITNGGNAAVAFFFVLSGFILVYAHCSWSRGLNMGPRTFYAARAARILPAYGLGLAIAAPFFLHAFLVSKQIDSRSFLLSGLLTPILMQSWAPLKDAQLWNLPGWSLSAEVFFYLLFPACWILARRFGIWVFAIGTLVALLTIGMAEQWCLAKPQTFCAVHLTPEFWAVFPLVHLPKFLFGMALGGVYLALPRERAALFDGLFLVSLLALVSAMSLAGSWTAVFGGTFLVILFGGLIFGAASSRIAISLLGHPALIWLGEASYAIYILHIPVITWLTFSEGKFATVIPNGVASFMLKVLIVTSAALFTLRFIERPMRSFIFGIFAPPLIAIVRNRSPVQSTAASSPSARDA